jgi:hypothetical protein
MLHTCVDTCIHMYSHAHEQTFTTRTRLTFKYQYGLVCTYRHVLTTHALIQARRCMSIALSYKQAHTGMYIPAALCRALIFVPLNPVLTLYFMLKQTIVLSAKASLLYRSISHRVLFSLRMYFSRGKMRRWRACTCDHNVSASVYM